METKQTRGGTKMNRCPQCNAPPLAQVEPPERSRQPYCIECGWTKGDEIVVLDDDGSQD